MYKFTTSFKKVMKKKRLDFKAVAKICKMSKGVVRQYETGKRIPGAVNIVKMSKGLKISSDKLLGIK